MPGQQRDRWTSSTEATGRARLPVAWTPEDAPPSRPRLGASPEDLAALERKRRSRVRIGVASAVLGLLAMLAGLVLRGGPSNDVNADLREALNLQNTGRLAEAAALYQEVIAAEPGTKIAYFNLGVIEQTQGLDAAAAANYEQALALDSEYTPALFNLAVLRADEGDTAAATALYRRVLAVDPQHAPALLNLGILMLQAGQEAEASELINRAIELDPSIASAGAGARP